jgi:hypothetical protein
MTAIRLTLVGIVLALPAVCGAVVIDDFSVGSITVATNGVQFNTATATQTGLPAEHVALGGREFRGQQVSSVVSLSVDTAGEGRFIYEAPVSGINTSVRYQSTTSVDLTAGGANHIVLRFASAMFDPPANRTPAAGFIDFNLSSLSGSRGIYLRVNNSAEPFNIAVPFSLLGAGSPTGFNPAQFRGLMFGTGNGNLYGTFVLDAIESAYVAPGDYNADGLVDAADYTVWRDFASATTHVNRGDGNADGAVNAGDYEVWRGNYGTGSGAAVPEPAAGVLFSVVLGGLLTRLR